MQIIDPLNATNYITRMLIDAVFALISKLQPQKAGFVKNFLRDLEDCVILSDKESRTLFVSQQELHTLKLKLPC